MGGPISSVVSPPRTMTITTTGSSFDPIIEVNAGAEILWTFHDSTTSTSATPTKNYGTDAIRTNTLIVTPWTAVLGINFGYNAEDGGYEDIDLIATQHVSAVDGLDLVSRSLIYFSALDCPLTQLDFREFRKLKYLELYTCRSMTSLLLNNNTALERLCVEDNNLNFLDISDCINLADIRGALNAYPHIDWGTSYNNLWHICIRDNPFDTPLPSNSLFPSLTELLIWNDRQTGVLDVSDNPNLQHLLASDNTYTGVYLATPNMLIEVNISRNSLDQSTVDYILQQLASSTINGGIVTLTGNTAPSVAGVAAATYLANVKGWDVNVDVAVDTLGLHGVVTWLSADSISVVYDWSTEDQLADWSLTAGSSFTRADGTVVINYGTTTLATMEWIQPIACSKLVAENTHGGSARHLNFYTNVNTFSGNVFNPNPGIGVVINDGSFWAINGDHGITLAHPAPSSTIGHTYQLDISTTQVDLISTQNNIQYTRTIELAPSTSGHVVLGSYGSSSTWGTVTITGKIVVP